MSPSVHFASSLVLSLVLFACGRDVIVRSGDGGGVGGSSSAMCLEDGDACMTNAECCSLQCSPQGCVPAIGCLNDGEQCRGDGECCTGFCDPSTSLCAGTMPCFAPGAECTGQLPCCSGKCSGGFCTGGKCAVSNMLCSTNAQCCSGSCVDSCGLCE